MKTLAVVSHKGGTGKSTLSIHLAIQAQSEGRDTLLVDLDHHSSTVAEWASIRTDKHPLAVTAKVSDIKELQQQATDEGFELLILDCPPYFNDDTDQITKLADFTILPTSPRFADICTLPRDIDRIHQPYAVVLNSCTPDSVNKTSFKAAQVYQMLNDSGIPVSPVHITRLEAFTEALTTAKVFLNICQMVRHQSRLKHYWTGYIRRIEFMNCKQILIKLGAERLAEELLRLSEHSQTAADRIKYITSSRKENLDRF